MAFELRELTIGIIIALLIGAVLGYLLVPRTDTTVLEQQINNLEDQTADLQDQVGSLQSQLSSMNDMLDVLEASKLEFVNLRGQDVRPMEGSPYLHTWGNICNVGTRTASNCWLHVELERGGTVIKDVYIDLGSIDGESWVQWDRNVYYDGDALTRWSITKEWTE